MTEFTFGPPKGFCDYFPEEAERLENLILKAREVFRKYGFRPMVLPLVERFEVLSAKTASESIADEIFFFEDKSGRKLGLRFDLTVPTARAVASRSVKLPFKRYAIGPVWRYDNPQRLRKREFWQADVDVFGSRSVRADVECVACACEFLESAGLEFEVRVNDRKLMEGLIGKRPEVFRIVDKLDKLGEEGVRKLLKPFGDAERIMKIVSVKGGPEVLSEFEGTERLEEFFSLAKAAGISRYLKADLSLVRGLDYYTSLVFEISVPGVGVSIGGGGRYDELLGVYGKPLPATGISVGLTRVAELLGPVRKREGVFVAVASRNLVDRAAEICRELREAGIRSEYEIGGRSLSAQLEYCDRTGVKTAVILGEKDLAEGKAVLRDMETGEERKVPLKAIGKALR